MTKNPKTFRLSDQAIEHLAALAERTGTTETAIVEMALAKTHSDYRTTPQDAPEIREIVIIAPDDNAITNAIEAISQQYASAHAIRVLAYLSHEDLAAGAARCEAYHWQDEPPALYFASDDELEARRAIWRDNQDAE